jgi:outer membrane protein OmpA-like peptidoglycan-associated protein
MVNCGGIAMHAIFSSHPRRFAVGLLFVSALMPACAEHRHRESTPRVTNTRPVVIEDTRHDRVAKSAALGAGGGAAAAVLIGKHRAEEILAGAAIGAVAGAGVGAYLDAQEARLAKVPGTTVERLDNDTLLLRFESDVLFPTNSDQPTPQSLATLAEVADVLVHYPKTAVVIQGHTDSVGPDEYNLELSERRAVAVKDLLHDRGVSDRRMAAIGHGERYPVASNRLDEGRRRNRRVTVLLKG